MAKPKKGVMVKTIVKTPVTYNDEPFAAGDLLDVDEVHPQQLLDVGAVALVKDDAPASESSAPADQGLGS